MMMMTWTVTLHLESMEVWVQWVVVVWSTWRTMAMTNFLVMMTTRGIVTIVVTPQTAYTIVTRLMRVMYLRRTMI